VTEHLAHLARLAGRMAVDTEFMTERRYRPMLCLAQFALRDSSAAEGIRTEVVDPLDGPRPGALAATLADPAVEVVVHAGRQDIALLKRVWETRVANVFDTQVAAGFLGYGTQESYRSLVRRVLGVSVASTESFTRWDRRPLTDDQLRYALEDARHLLELGEALEGELERAGRLEWAREECRWLEGVSDARDPDALFERLPGVARLRPPARAIARELVEWREAVAREIDRNAGSVLPDHFLVEGARQAPRGRRALNDVRGLPESLRRRRSGGLLEAVARGARRPAPVLAPTPRPAAAADAPVASLLGAVVRHRALDARVAAGLIATRDELTQLVSCVREGGDARRFRVLQGWRAKLVGEELLEVLAGTRVVGVVDARRLEVGPPGAQAAG
jgi:ribonuclease D